MQFIHGNSQIAYLIHPILCTQMDVLQVSEQDGKIFSKSAEDRNCGWLIFISIFNVNWLFLFIYLLNLPCVSLSNQIAQIHTWYNLNVIAWEVIKLVIHLSHFNLIESAIINTVYLVFYYLWDDFLFSSLHLSQPIHFNAPLVSCLVQDDRKRDSHLRHLGVRVLNRKRWIYELDEQTT